MNIATLFTAWLLFSPLCGEFSLQAEEHQQSISLPEIHVERQEDFRLHLEVMASLPNGFQS